MKHIIKNNDGSVLLAIVLMLPFIIMIAGLYTGLTLSSLSVAKKDQSRTHAQLAADAGIDAAMEQINQQASWLGSGTEVEVQNSAKIRTTYQTQVSDIDSNTKSLVSTGRTFRGNSSTQDASVTITVKLRSVKAGQYSVVSGVGGLFMQNSAKILGGDVYVNGEINMQNSAQIGLTTNPLTVKAAHQNCPVPPTALYPRLCNSGENGQPINITSPARIYGSVSANNQASSAGMSSPGLIASFGVTPQPLPSHDRAAQKANVSTATSSSYYLTCDMNNAIRNWPGRLKIVGDVVISKNCKVILEGDVWITGKLTLQNSAQIVTADGITLGGQNTVDGDLPSIMVDGQNGIVLQNSASFLSNNNSVGMQAVTYWSRAACSPDCSDVTGADLYNSRADRTISVDNNANAPDTLFYARWTQAELSNGGGIGAVAGQTVRLSNSATITFSSSTSTGTAYWVIDNYRRTFQ